MSIYTALSGGLGNQMFQYATARALADRIGADLVLDDWSGFVRDRQYRRHYELGGLPIRGRTTSALERLPIWIYRAQDRWLSHSARGGAIKTSRSRPVNGRNCDSAELVTPHAPASALKVLTRPYGTFIVERRLRFAPELLSTKLDNAWLVGYWQAPRYFGDIANLLRTEMMPPLPEGRHFNELGALLRQQTTVALGIRLYEESPNPAAHARNGKEKSLVTASTALHRLLTRFPGTRVALFCTHRARSLEQLQLPNDTLYITHEEGYIGSLERLWLLAQCRHHIFLNSSFYWWGAWLSAVHHGGPEGGQIVMAADNFVNPDSYEQQWEKF